MSRHIDTRLKRLLHADRLPGRKPRSKSREQSTYAFFPRELAGSGNENLYSPFEAFAILLGIRLLENGFPQRVVVRILRSIHSKLGAGLDAEWRSVPVIDYAESQAEEPKRSSINRKIEVVSQVA
ncbi:MAG: hypothetical protein ABSG88_12700 [Bradyrhizobium sp.]